MFDEAGGDHHFGGVERERRLPTPQIPDCGDPVAVHTDVGVAAGSSRSVHDEAAAHDDVKHRSSPHHASA